MTKQQSSTPLLPILIIFAVIVSGLFFLFKPQQEAPVTPASPSQENTAQSSVKKGITSPENLDAIHNPQSPIRDEDEILLRLAPMEAPITNPCFEATQRLNQFFDYLDEQEYIQNYHFPNGSKEMISNLINTLLDSPPLLNEKSFNGTDIIRNTAHIYRILGAQNLNILLKIITNEADIMEETSTSFHEWFTISTQCLNHSYPLRPTLDNLYEYASFAMQTTGGRAYLARREGNLRLLAQYYCVLIIHQADQQNLNKYNINLSPLLAHIIGEMEGTDELAGKSTYLAALYEIRKGLSEHTFQ